MLKVEKPAVGVPVIGLVDKRQSGLHAAILRPVFIVKVSACLKQIRIKAVIVIIGPESRN
jgi:hypothetical protein